MCMRLLQLHVPCVHACGYSTLHACMHAATTLARALHACMRLLHTAAAEWLVVVPRRCRCSPPFGFWLQKATGGRQEAAHESAGQESCGDEEESSGDWSLSRFQDEWWEHSKGVREDTPDMVRWLRRRQGGGGRSSQQYRQSVMGASGSKSETSGEDEGQTAIERLLGQQVSSQAGLCVGTPSPHFWWDSGRNNNNNTNLVVG